MTQQQLQILKVVFLSAVGLTVIATLGSITDKVVHIRSATRTESTQGAPIAVPADPGPATK